MTEIPFRIFLKGDEVETRFNNEEHNEKPISDCIEIDLVITQLKKLSKVKLEAWLNELKNRPK